MVAHIKAAQVRRELIQQSLSVWFLFKVEYRDNQGLHQGRIFQVCFAVI